MSNFRQVDRKTGFLLPPSVDERLPERHLARFVVEVIEQLDMSRMVKAYRGSGSASYHPSVLLGLLVYGYATGVFSSRKLERATYDSVAFRFIAANDHPDHDTIATFRRRFLGDIKQLFVEVLALAREAGMLKLGTVALDGTKVHANASRHSALSYEHASKLAAERLHGDDTTVPILAKVKAATGRIWTYVRDDRSFGGPAPPAALYYASRDRTQEHPARHLQNFTGILQADAYGCYNGLYDPARIQGAVTPALCWAHARRQFFELADIAGNARRGRNASAISPVALEAVRRIDALFAIERGINGLVAEERLRVRQERSAPLVVELEAWLRDERSRLSRSASVTKPIDYMLKRWDRFAGFLTDGRICLTNNAAERALRGFALGRKAWLFAGSERGADRAAVMATLIQTAKLGDVDPRPGLPTCLPASPIIP